MLTEMIAAAIVSLSPRISGEMIDKYASDIAAAVNDVDEECGHDDRPCLELALALVVVQHEESSWRSDVETCKVVGDGGAAIGAHQTHRHWWRGRTKKEICASNRLSASLAAHALMTLRRGDDYGVALQRYVGCPATDRRAVRRRNTLRRLKALPEVRAALAEEGSNEQS